MHDFVELLVLTAVLGQDAFFLMDHLSDKTLRQLQQHWYGLVEVYEWDWSERGRAMRADYFAHVGN